jgi:hypothetical protein
MKGNAQRGRWFCPCAKGQGFGLVGIQLGTCCLLVAPYCLADGVEISWVGDKDRYVICICDDRRVSFMSNRDSW